MHAERSISNVTDTVFKVQTAAMQVAWSPYENNLFAGLLHDTLTLYAVESSAERPPNAQSKSEIVCAGRVAPDIHKLPEYLTYAGIELSRHTFCSPVIVTRTPFYVRCLDWCPTNEFGRLVAAGSANGRLAIVGFADSPGHRDNFRSVYTR